MADKGGAALSAKSRRRIADRTESYIIKHLPDFIGALEELAMGILVEKTDGRSGDKNIYTQAPDRQALQFLIEHGLGKVPQRHELTGEEGGPIGIVPWMPKVEVGTATTTAGPVIELEGELDAEAWGPPQGEKDAIPSKEEKV